jgi:hypothetical protein
VGDLHYGKVEGKLNPRTSGFPLLKKKLRTDVDQPIIIVVDKTCLSHLWGERAIANDGQRAVPWRADPS